MCRYLFVRCDNEPAPWSSEGEQHLCTLPGAVRHCQIYLPPPFSMPPCVHPAGLPGGAGLLPWQWLTHAPSCCPLAETGDRPGLETNLPEAAQEEIKNADKGQVWGAGIRRCTTAKAR